jgi:hypothetical protein
MERRNLLAGLLVLALSLFLLTGTALAHKTGKKSKSGKETTDPGACVIHSLPSFMDQGFGGAASSVADIIEIECEPVYAETYVKISSQELYNRCDDRLYWVPWTNSYIENDVTKAGDGELPSSASIGGVELDDDGNAIVAVLGGPSCAPGESVISVHQEEAPGESTATSFTVLPPKVTTPGVFAWPESQVEAGNYSNTVSIFGVEFPPAYSERWVAISDEQLYSHCDGDLFWVVMTSWGPYVVPFAEGTELELDNDGNAFVTVFGGPSCAAGDTELEASLVRAPYTTYGSYYTVLPPEPTI